MSKPVEISSTSQFSSLLSSSSIVVADFYADWCGPCKQIAPIYAQLAAELSRPNKITFTKINTDKQEELARAYGVRAMPTFMIFKNARQIEMIQGADGKKLSAAVKSLVAEVNRIGDDDTAESSGQGGTWLGAALPKGYDDVTNEIDVRGSEMMNYDVQKGDIRTLFGTSKPSATTEGKDFVQSDTDEQLMLYVPFQSMLKVHTIHITSNPSSSEEDEDEDDDEIPSRPKVLRLYTNRPRILNFSEADNIEPTQEIELDDSNWDSKTHTAKIELRFVKFQNVSSLVLFVVESEGSNEKVRIDRIRMIGESGEKRDGKIEKKQQED